MTTKADNWTTFVRETKQAQWGEPVEEQPQMFYDKFNPPIFHPAVRGEHNEIVESAWHEYPVVSGWDFNKWTAEVRMAGVPKTSSAVTRNGQRLRG